MMTNYKDELLVNLGLREELIGRVEVLGKVKELLLLPNMEFATTQQVADFYEVPFKTIESLASYNREELEIDGYSSYRKDFIIESLNIDSQCLKIGKGKTVVFLPDGNELIIGNRGMRLFTRRSILRVGMLLRDSKIAKEIRTQLLNIEEKTSIEIKVQDINEEQDLMLAVGMAMAKGDINALAQASTNMMAFSNRHIAELQTTIEVNMDKVNHYDQVLSLPDLINISVIAKDLGMSGLKLNNILKDLKVIYKQGKTYMPYAKYQYLVTDGYCDYYNFYNKEKDVSTNTLKWTEKGREFIVNLLNTKGSLN